MKKAATKPMKRTNRPGSSEDVIRQVRREQEEILSQLLKIQSETLRGRPPSRIR